MDSPEEQNSAPIESRAPRGGLLLMVVILATLALLAVYSNVQKARRDQIETVTIKPAGWAQGTPAPSPSPAAP